MLTIGGVRQSEVLEILGISRSALYRYRKAKDWAGEGEA
jgi:predicted DNA-binding transcriptional regulator AlpA